MKEPNPNAEMVDLQALYREHYAEHKRHQQTPLCTRCGDKIKDYYAWRIRGSYYHKICCSENGNTLDENWEEK